MPLAGGRSAGVGTATRGGFPEAHTPGHASGESHGQRPRKDLGVFRRGWTKRKGRRWREEGAGVRRGIKKMPLGYLRQGMDLTSGEPWQVSEQGHDLVGFVF